MLHQCDVTSCINPEHLFLGTQRDNCLDMYRKGRDYDKSGTSNPRSRLTIEQVNAIRSDKRPQYLIAAEYGVSQSTISRVQRKEVY